MTNTPPPAPFFFFFSITSYGMGYSHFWMAVQPTFPFLDGCRAYLLSWETDCEKEKCLMLYKRCSIKGKTPVCYQHYFSHKIKMWHHSGSYLGSTCLSSLPVASLPTNPYSHTHTRSSCGHHRHPGLCDLWSQLGTVIETHTHLCIQRAPH